MNNNVLTPFQNKSLLDFDENFDVNSIYFFYLAFSWKILKKKANSKTLWEILGGQHFNL